MLKKNALTVALPLVTYTALGGLGVVPTLAVGAEEPVALDEVVVNARKRTESLQDVPISVTAIGAEQLANAGATSLKDIRNLVPSLHYSDRGALQTNITIRGVGGDSRSIGLESGVAMYIDGVYAGRTSAYNMDLAEIQAVEVLRGPQGTLFGKNTTGGAISIRTKKPDGEFGGNVSIGYGNFEAIRAKGNVSFGLNERTFASLTAATWDRDGYLNNAFNGSKLQTEERRSGRFQLRYLASDALELNVSLDASRDRTDAVLNQLGSNAAFGSGFYSPNTRSVNTDQRNAIARDILGGSLTADYKFVSGMTLTSITAFRDVEVEVFSDIDQTPVDRFRSGPFTDNAKHVTQEFRLASAGEQAIDYVLGLYYFKQQADASRRIYQFGNPLFFTDGPLDTESYAAFANLDFNVGDRLTFTTGVRLTSEDKEGSYRQTSSVRPFNKNIPVLDLSETAFSWMGAARYEFADDVSGYISVNRGFKSGGFNVDPLATPAPLTAAELTFEQEQVTSYEVGVKGELFDRRARLGASVFFAQYEDRQVPQFETVGGVPTVITRNAGEAEIKGFELEFTVLATDSLLFNGGVSILDGEYTDFRGATTGGANFTGNTTENTPYFSANLGAQWKRTAGPGEFLFAPQLTYQGKTYLQPDNGRFNQENGYALLGVRTGYSWSDGKYGIFAWGKNLTDEVYKEFARQFSGSDQVLWGEPRTYGVEFAAKF